MSRRNVLLIGVVVAAVVAGLVVWSNRDTTLDATTSDAPMATASNEAPVTFDEPAWTRPLPEGGEVLVDSPYAIVRERTGVRIYELRTGAERWHYLDSDLVVTSATAYFNRLAVVTGHEVRVFDLHSGELFATVPFSGGPRTAVPFTDTFLVLSDGTDTHRMYWNDGEALWSEKPMPCATSSGVITGASEVVLAHTCGERVVLESLDPRAGGTRWSHEVPNAVEPPAVTLIPKNAPALVKTKDDHVVAVDMITGAPQPARAVAPGAELTSMYNGWCAYEPTPAPAVRCVDAATGVAVEKPYRLRHDGSTVSVTTYGPGIQVAGTTRTSLTVGTVGGSPKEVLPGTTDPHAVYYGPGALVVTANGTVTVYA